MAYTTKEDYTTWLKGRAETVPLTEFEFWAARASEHIDLVTFNRLRDSETLAQYQTEARNAACALAEFLYKNQEYEGFSSISQGGFSASLNPMNKQIAGIIRSNLALTGLMYRGQ